MLKGQDGPHVEANSDATQSVSQSPAVRRAIAQRLPQVVTVGVPKFCDAALAVNPHRSASLCIGHWSAVTARHRIDEDSRIVHVLDIDHCQEIYRRPQP